MFRILDMIDEFRVQSFLFVLSKFSWWFFRCFDKLFSALDRLNQGSIKV